MLKGSHLLQVHPSAMSICAFMQSDKGNNPIVCCVAVSSSELNLIFKGMVSRRIGGAGHCTSEWEQSRRSRVNVDICALTLRFSWFGLTIPKCPCVDVSLGAAGKQREVQLFSGHLNTKWFVLQQHLEVSTAQTPPLCKPRLGNSPCLKELQISVDESWRRGT